MVKAELDTPTIYDQCWNPQAYLRQYYTQSFIPDDEVVIQQRLVAFLKQQGRTFARAIDVGCGPTVHLLTALAPYVGEFHLADYLQENLVAVGQWLRNEEGAHNWDLNISYVLELETQRPVSTAEVEARKQQIRQKITALSCCDIRRSQPLGKNAAYDFVLSAYCVDAATNSKQEWQQWLGNLLTLCAENGTVMLISAHQAQHYLIANQFFPFAQVEASDIQTALLTAGFDPQQTLLETIPIKTWAEAGFDHIIIAIATKRSGRGSW